MGPTPASSRPAASRIKTLSWIRERLRRRAEPEARDETGR